MWLPPLSLHTGTSLEPPGPEWELLSGLGMWLWGALSLTLWSIHALMNEEGVKGRKAGVVCVCACAYTPSVVFELLYGPSESIQQEQSWSCPSVFDTLSMVDKTNVHADQLWFKNVLFSGPSWWEHERNSIYFRVQILFLQRTLSVHASSCIT